MTNEEKRRLKNLYTTLCDVLCDAPEENECTEEQNEVYADCTNLKCSLEAIF